jgi:hypothetical protein
MRICGTHLHCERHHPLRQATQLEPLRRDPPVASHAKAIQVGHPLQHSNVSASRWRITRVIALQPGSLRALSVVLSVVLSQVLHAYQIVLGELGSAIRTRANARGSLHPIRWGLGPELLVSSHFFHGFKTAEACAPNLRI